MIDYHTWKVFPDRGAAPRSPRRQRLQPCVEELFPEAAVGGAGDRGFEERGDGFSLGIGKGLADSGEDFVPAPPEPAQEHLRRGELTGEEFLAFLVFAVSV